jgi:hypothetical protein
MKNFSASYHIARVNVSAFLFPFDIGKHDIAMIIKTAPLWKKTFLLLILVSLRPLAKRRGCCRRQAEKNLINLFAFLFLWV